uniref:deoxyribose-phosphate aldolase n=1 Tax=Echinococcus granulosus TaxID=6210 RepID=A0A068WM72_ECHGR|nr:deoxyribose phosphate aldolase [Echinococcus granulosus]
MKSNTISAFDRDLVHSSVVDASNINVLAKDLSSIRLEGNPEIQWLLRTVGFIDLTTLAGDDTSANVHRLCAKAKRPLSTPILDKLSERYGVTPGEQNAGTAAVCVYPYQVKTALDYLERIGASYIPIAAVATGFPSGQYSLKSRLEEIRYAIDSGASEIDIVINRTLALEGRWRDLYDEICEMRTTCGNRAHLKTILAVGELGSYANVYAASMTCMLAGADFIKTSTGKESTVNATLPISVVMCRAIADFQDTYGIKVGYKPAGGLKTWKDALEFTALVHSMLGPDWVNREYFRIGASSLLGGIESRIYSLLHNTAPRSGDLALM